MKKEIIVTGIITALSVFFALGGDKSLSHYMLMWLCIVFVVIFYFSIALFLKEKPRDEREEAHFKKADRLAYVVATFLLASYIAYQGIWSEIDPVLSAILGIIVLSRTIILLNSQKDN